MIKKCPQRLRTKGEKNNVAGLCVRVGLCAVVGGTLLMLIQ